VRKYLSSTAEEIHPNNKTTAEVPEKNFHHPIDPSDKGKSIVSSIFIVALCSVVSKVFSNSNSHVMISFTY
jgi:hypothetical protein